MDELFEYHIFPSAGKYEFVVEGSCETDSRLVVVESFEGVVEKTEEAYPAVHGAGEFHTVSQDDIFSPV